MWRCVEVEKGGREGGREGNTVRGSEREMEKGERERGREGGREGGTYQWYETGLHDDGVAELGVGRHVGKIVA